MPRSRLAQQRPACTCSTLDGKSLERPDGTRLVLDDRRNGFHLLMLTACVIAGVSGIVDPGRASIVVHEVLPRWELYLWYGGLTTGGLVSLAGLVVAIPTGYYMERIGLNLLVGLLLSYVVAALSAGVHALAFGLIMVCAFAAACVARLVRVRSIIGRR